VIEPLKRGERNYLAQFGVTAIYITCSCMLGVGHDLARVGSGCRRLVGSPSRREAEQVLVAIGERHPATVDEATRELLAAAGRLDVVLSEHTVVLARARAAVAKLDRRLAMAKETGTLAFFNAEYRRRRIAARASGKGFMSYGAAHRRLRKAIAGAAATGSMPELMRAVFG
jgi:hypothetical protein